MIRAQIICDSEFNGKRVTTFELEYPRFIHSELLTHRVFSRNAASSRAIPIEKMIEQAQSNTAVPTWTQNQSGMQGEVITDLETVNLANCIWNDTLLNVVHSVRELIALGVHKQEANRLLEPFTHIKTVLTGTEFSNFFHLRYHKDAAPDIYKLAQAMLAQYHTSVPTPLTLGREFKSSWHLPYAPNNDELSLQDELKISASCCAQVSYRLSDDSLNKAKTIFDRLIPKTHNDPLHASPFEHQCTPISLNEQQHGNLIGFLQQRHTIENAIKLK